MIYTQQIMLFLKNVNDEMRIDMNNKEFEILYNKVKNISLLQEQKEYKELKKLKLVDGSFEDFQSNNKKETKNIDIDPEKQKKINDCIIYKDIIEREDLIFNLYLCKFKSILPPKLEDYKVLPLEEETYYEYGCILEYNENDVNYSLNNILSGYELDNHVAIDKYTAMKNKIVNNTVHEIFDEINEYLDKIAQK